MQYVILRVYADQSISSCNIYNLINNDPFSLIVIYLYPIKVSSSLSHTQESGAQDQPVSLTPQLTGENFVDAGMALTNEEQEKDAGVRIEGMEARPDETWEIKDM